MLAGPRPRDPVGFQNSATSPDMGFYAARSYSLMRPPRTAGAGSAYGKDQRQGDRAAAGGAAAAMRASSVVVSLILRQDRPQMPLAENDHPVSDLGPGGEYEPFRISVRARAPGRDLHDLDASVGQDRVEGCGELPGPVTDQEPEAISAIT